ncbi:MAG: hypothetical protein FWC92_11655 [Defluviitaleaceae bacterium]|nr:hypothetical protein [Defluviitaleaceae bacterium]
MFNLKIQFYLYIFITCAIFVDIVLRIVGQDEFFVPFLLRNLATTNSIWVLYYDQKSNGIMAIKSQMQKSDDRLYLKSFLLFLYGSMVLFILVFISEIVMKQNMSVSVLMILIIALAGILFCLYKVIRIVTTNPKVEEVNPRKDKPSHDHP